MVIERIVSDVGYTEIKTDEVDITTKFEIILHMIYPEELINMLENLEKIANKYKTELGENSEIIYKQISNVKSKIRTIIPHRAKRGLINLGGTILSWLFGTMDSGDKENIERHLEITNKNQINIINSANQQIKINNNFNESLKSIITIINSDRAKILNNFNQRTLIEKQILRENLYLDLNSKINTIKEHVEHIQQNVASARFGLLNPNILTSEEINTYKIDFKKLANIRLGVAKYSENIIIFAIKIPVKIITVNKILLIPVTNTRYEQINEEYEFYVKINGKLYVFEENKSIDELKESRNCIIKRNCKMIHKNREEFLEIDNNIIILSNMHNVKLNSSCDQRTLTLKGNYFISYNNCTIQIGDQIYFNKESEFIDRFVIQNNNYTKFFNRTLSFQEIILNTENNLNQIEHLKFHKKVNYTMITITIIIIVLILIFMITNWYCKHFKTNCNKKDSGESQI